MEPGSWDLLVEEALAKLEQRHLLRSLRPIHLSTEKSNDEDGEFEVFDRMQPFDRSSVQVNMSEITFQEWLDDIPSSAEILVERSKEEKTSQRETLEEVLASVCSSSGEEIVSSSIVENDQALKFPHQFRNLLLFSGNDYLGLSSHPTIAKAAAKAAMNHRMGPRGSALICGYTRYHRILESSLADLKKKEDCLLCPTGFAANMALMVALGNIGSLLAVNRIPLEDEKIAVFSDALNHASIIDGLRLAEKQQSVKVLIYRHCDMAHLNELLTGCTLKKKVVVTDSLFSMDGDFAPLAELAKLRKKHGFLLVIDDVNTSDIGFINCMEEKVISPNKAHGTFVCGNNGGGVAEQFNCEKDVDICVGTLSKAAGCHGGFIACSKRWKLLLQSRGRSFIFSTAAPIPIIAAAHAAVIVARKEKWRRRAIWDRVQDFYVLTGIPISSPIISLIVGSEENALQASRHMIKSGFHVTAIRPPTVAANSCRLRVTLCATHTREDLKKLTAALSECINFRDIFAMHNSNRFARL